MLLFPNAKINLGLNILSRRPDKYHDISTVFYPVGWSDALEVISAEDDRKECRLHLSGLPVDGDVQDNLVVKAYRMLAQDYPLPSVEVYLHKAIPFGAGLGGGSADASCMLRLLRDMFSLPLSDDDLAVYAARLGADCPFFIYNRPMLAEGIGERLSPIDISLRGYFLVLVKPEISVSTADAYSLVTPAVPSLSLPDVLSRPVVEWKELLVNDFEKSVFKHYPVLSHLKQRLYDKGAVYVSMSGSGSTMYGLFEILPKELYFPDSRIWTGTCAY